VTFSQSLAVVFKKKAGNKIFKISSLVFLSLRIIFFSICHTGYLPAFAGRTVSADRA
jgi:hypothetical protein